MWGMDRVRIGLTGLGAVFLLTLGTSLVFGNPAGNKPAAESRKEPGEPLAQLGVAPGSDKLEQALPNGDMAKPDDRAEGDAPDVQGSGMSGPGTMKESPVGAAHQRSAADLPVAI